MGLESATYIADLVTTNPPGGDGIAQGDNHLRLIKSTLQNTLPNAINPFQIPRSVALQAVPLTLTAADAGKIIPVDGGLAGGTVNLPASGTIYDGWQVEILKADADMFTVTIDGNGSDPINGNLTLPLYQSYQSVVLRWCSAISGWIGKQDPAPPKGLVIPGVGTTLIPGFLWMNGLSIGDGSSGATALASAAAKGLFKLLWNSMADAQAAVSGGRGANAEADWNAHKKINLPNLCGRTVVGLDNIGGVGDQGILGFNSAGVTNGEVFGADSVALSTAQLASHTHTGATDSQGTHSHGYNHSDFSNNVANVVGGVRFGPIASFTTDAAGAHTHNVTIDATGSGALHQNMQPSMTLSWMIKY